MISAFFIDRPNAAIVISLVILLLGTIAIVNLPVSQYPRITPPVIQVSATYTGADAETIERTVATPLETQINGTPGMAYLESTSSNEGLLTINITFEVGTDINAAAVEVQNRINVAEPFLPEEVRRLGITIRQRNPSLLLIVSLFSPEGSHGIDFLNNYANIYVKDELLRVPGVGDIFTRAQDFSMRIWLQPDKLFQLGITASEITAALREQNIQVAAGSIGTPPQRGYQAFEYTLFTNGRLETQEEFENVILKVSEEDGRIVYLRDVARVELGRFDYSVNNFTDKKPAAYLIIFQTPDSNILDVEEGIIETMERLRKAFPSDVDYVIPFESASVVRVSIGEVIETLIIALLLVSFVVFIFLQNWRSTLIPILIIPVSIIGTFALFLPLGFSINNLTLFGFVLAIGIVVDDAIVVVEATMAYMEREGISAKEAVKKAMGDIAGPVVAMSLIVAAVFIPVGFIPGIVGRLYQQFAMAVAASGIISGFVALSLTPALCSLILKPSSISKRSKGLGRFFYWFNRKFDAANTRYEELVHKSYSYTGVFLIGLLGLGVLTWFLFNQKPTGFIPNEDEGRLFVTYELPEGASTARSLETINKLMDILGEEEDIFHFTAVTGLNAVNFSSKSNSGTVFCQLKPWSERKGKGQGAFAIRDRLLSELAQKLPEASIVIVAPAAIPGLGSTSGFSVVFQEMEGTLSIQEFEAGLQDFVRALNQSDEISNAFSFFSASTPAYKINLDRDKAARQGVNIGDAFLTLQTYLGSIYVNDFILYGRNFRVVAQADTMFREDLGALRNFFVKNNRGQMTPISNLVETELVENAPLISHFNLFRSATVNGDAASGYSSGQAIERIRQIASTLPAGLNIDFSGISREEINSGGSTMIIFLLSIVFVFLCLTALYESWSVPFSVMLAVPSGVFGAMLTLTLFPSLTNNVYAQIGLLTLIALAAKNAILIVEYAKDRVDRGMSIKKAATIAASLRLRPILMTSFAFILGVVPLAFAGGAGSVARQTIGWTVLGGMLTATFFTISLVPILFVLVTKIAYSKEELRNLKSTNKSKE
ncbi:RND efflux system, inner membrane transporter CmeB [Lunatimonas lonarensis]|uniref:RND efflux system, inner membrane transporter CmeB n=1 Tax=Lunatimonas lonarensis TaxID=1232681 RepID=R7ZPC4_9BACT|nr:efflux RND transporter permease subunit [Lunatimonas lonarensis]EON75966.1 RND efflux system, inner membrane transporter CmeB [Lunatimonas lonarensis]